MYPQLVGWNNNCFITLILFFQILNSLRPLKAYRNAFQWLYCINSKHPLQYRACWWFREIAWLNCVNLLAMWLCTLLMWFKKNDDCLANNKLNRTFGVNFFEYAITWYFSHISSCCYAIPHKHTCSTFTTLMLHFGKLLQQSSCIKCSVGSFPWMTTY